MTHAATPRNMANRVQIVYPLVSGIFHNFSELLLAVFENAREVVVTRISAAAAHATQNGLIISIVMADVAAGCVVGVRHY